MCIRDRSLIVYRLDQLEHKQDKYNHLQERVFTLERNGFLQVYSEVNTDKLVGGTGAYAVCLLYTSRCV